MNPWMPFGGWRPKRHEKLGLALVISGVLLIVLPVILFPTNVILSTVLHEANEHHEFRLLELEAGTYEIWYTESWVAFIHEGLDLLLVQINHTSGEELPIHIRPTDKTRRIEGDECKRFCRFTVEERDVFDIFIGAGFLTFGLPGTVKVYIVEERPALYGFMQVTGGITIITGIVAFTMLYLLSAARMTEDVGRGIVRDTRQLVDPPPPPQPPPWSYNRPPYVNPYWRHDPEWSYRRRPPPY